MPPLFLIPVLVVFAAGLGFGVQAPLNAALGRLIGGGVAAATISFGVGFVALFAMTFAFGQGAALARAGGVAPVYWIGGLFGALVVWAMLWSVPTVGILTALAALILGQLASGLLLDATGAFGLPIHAVTPTRVLACLMVGGGLILSRF